MHGVVIGVSPSKRTTGVAVLQEQRLIDWGVHTKNTAALAAISSAIDEHSVTILAVLRCRENANPLLCTLRALADANHIPVKYCSSQELKANVPPYGHRTMRMLFLHLTELYPELIPPYHKYLRQSNAYWQKVFEAVASATAV